MRHRWRARPMGAPRYSAVLVLPASILMLAMGMALAQTRGSGAGAGGGGAAAAPGGSSAPSAGSVPFVAPTVPAQPAPGVANTPVDPGRSNVDANPPTRQLEGANPVTTSATTAGPAPRNDQAGGTQSAPQGGAARRPGAAQSANSDGYSECMAMWKPSNTGMSRGEWSKTCDRARLTPK
jgi:hypothetical protein